jgi:hypothetical protein
MAISGEQLRLLDERAQVGDELVLADMEPQPAFLEPGEIEQVVDELQELERAPVHGVEGARRGIAELSHLTMQQQLERRQDQGERRTQLMGHVREEPRLELVELAEVGVGALELRTRLLELHALDDLLALCVELNHLTHPGDHPDDRQKCQVG